MTKPSELIKKLSGDLADDGDTYHHFRRFLSDLKRQRKAATIYPPEIHSTVSQPSGPSSGPHPRPVRARKVEGQGGPRGPKKRGRPRTLTRARTATILPLAGRAPIFYTANQNNRNAQKAGKFAMQECFEQRVNSELSLAMVRLMSQQSSIFPSHAYSYPPPSTPCLAPNTVYPSTCAGDTLRELVTV